MNFTRAIATVFLLSSICGTALTGCAASKAPMAAPASAADEQDQNQPAKAAAPPARATSLDEEEDGVATGNAEQDVNAIEDVEALFADAAQDLERALGGAGPAEDAMVAPAAPAAPAAGSKPRPSAPGAAAASRRNRHRNVCDWACRALGSMRRSADRLCELAGDDDERCVRVRERASNARERVENACPDCEAAAP